MLAITVFEAPFASLNSEGLRRIPVTCAVTLTVHLATYPPSLVCAEIIAAPFPTAVTRPFALTFAALVLLDVHVMLLLLALLGDTVASRRYSSPLFRLSEVLFSLTPVTSTFFTTVTLHFAMKPPSTVTAIITAEPAETPVTTPSVVTVATLVLLEVQLTLLSVAVLGTTVAVSVYF